MNYERNDIYMEKIVIKGLKIYGYHGVNPEEKKKGQNFILDITLHVNLSNACYSDDIADTVNYSSVIKFISSNFTEKTFNLIEAAAQHIANAVLNEFKAVIQIDLSLKKPEAKVMADFKYVGVEISRIRVVD
jgi:dihydroneopterin aldolase